MERGGRKGGRKGRSAPRSSLSSHPPSLEIAPLYSFPESVHVFLIMPSSLYENTNLTHHLKRPLRLLPPPPPPRPSSILLAAQKQWEPQEFEPETVRSRIRKVPFLPIH